MGGYVHGEVLPGSSSSSRGGGLLRRRGRGRRSKRRRRRRFVDLGAALCRYCQACACVQTDGEVDVVACYEASAVGEEEEERDGLWWWWR